MSVTETTTDGRIRIEQPCDCWPFRCPTKRQHSNWACRADAFHCLECSRHFDVLLDLRTDELRTVDEFDYGGGTLP